MKEIAFPIARCPVCGSKDGVELRSYPGRSALFHSRQLIRCSACMLVFVHPMPSADELTAYNRSYFESAHAGSPKDPAALAFFNGMARLRLQHILSYLKDPGLDRASILEIGPGLGFLCKHILAHSPAARYVAVETDLSCHENLEVIGARVFERFDQLEKSSAGFDLLVLSHVLEHTPDPIAFLEPAIRLLKPGGAAFIEVPCRDHEHKPDLEPHLLFFDTPSMERLLTHLGLVDLQLTYHGQLLGRIRNQQRIAARLRTRLMRLASPLINMLGLVPEIEGIVDPAERAAIAPYEPHIMRDQPAWWLRALARRYHD